MNILSKKVIDKIVSLKTGNVQRLRGVIINRKARLTMSDAHSFAVSLKSSDIIELMDVQPMYKKTYRLILKYLCELGDLGGACFVSLKYLQRAISDKEINLIFENISKNPLHSKVTRGDIEEFLGYMKTCNRLVPEIVVRHELQYACENNNLSAHEKVDAYRSSVNLFPNVDKENKILDDLFKSMVYSSNIEGALLIKQKLNPTTYFSQRERLIVDCARVGYSHDSYSKTIILLDGVISSEEKKIFFKTLRSYRHTLSASLFAADHLDVEDLRTIVRSISRRLGYLCPLVSGIVDSELEFFIQPNTL